MAPNFWEEIPGVNLSALDVPAAPEAPTFYAIVDGDEDEELSEAAQPEEPTIEELLRQIWPRAGGHHLFHLENKKQVLSTTVKKRIP